MLPDNTCAAFCVLSENAVFPREQDIKFKFTHGIGMTDLQFNLCNPSIVYSFYSWQLLRIPKSWWYKGKNNLTAFWVRLGVLYLFNFQYCTCRAARRHLNFRCILPLNTGCTYLWRFWGLIWACAIFGARRDRYPQSVCVAVHDHGQIRRPVFCLSAIQAPSVSGYGTAQVQ